MPRITVKQAWSRSPDPKAAVAELAAAIDQPDLQVVLFFCGSGYPLPALGQALRAAFSCPVVGCTSSGQIGTGGFHAGGISAMSLGSKHLTVTPHLLAPLAESQRCASQVAAEVRSTWAHRPEGWKSFGLVLVDGLSLAEERLMAALYQSLGELPMIGGSAGDDLEFEQTHVYWDGGFHAGAGVLAVFDTPVPFAALKVQHFKPTDRRLVITAANPAKRVVHEINGVPATDAYAELLGLTADEVTPAVFSRHPVMLKIGAEHYIRSIAKVNPDHSMTFFCAIEEGLVLAIGEALDPVQVMTTGFDEAARAVGPPSVVLGCDCVLRRLEYEASGTLEMVGTFLSARKVFGFSTYGEQVNAIHVNQTFAGIALGS